MKVKYTEYPQNFLYAVLQDENRVDSIILSDDVISGINYVISTLSEIEQKVVTFRFIKGKNKNQTAVEIGVSASRVRDVEAKALRKLSHPRRVQFMILGIQGYLEQKSKTEYQRGYQNGFVEGVESQRNESCDESEIERYLNDEKNIPLEELGLSIRSFNCLKRAGCNTLGDVLSITPEQAMKVRNLGRMSAREVAHALIKMNIMESSWNVFLED